MHCVYDNRQRGHTINGKNYVNWLRQLRKSLKIKRPGKLMNGVFSHEDIVPAYKSLFSLVDARDFELIDHSSYFPDLVSSDSYLFPSKSGHYDSEYNAIFAATAERFDQQDERVFTNEIQARQHRVWTARGCIC